MSKQREALELALKAIESGGAVEDMMAAEKAIQEALAEPELEFWPGDVLICKEDNTKVTVVHGNRGPMQLMNGKIAVAWDDNVGGEYTIAQIKEMFYQDEKPEPEQEPVADSDLYAVWLNGLHSRKPLNDEQIDALRKGEDKLNFVTLREFRVIARAIERAHKIGEA